MAPPCMGSLEERLGSSREYLYDGLACVKVYVNRHKGPPCIGILEERLGGSREYLYDGRVTL